ncbi:MAG: 2-oxo acid dehydrogenase subunit E2 [Crocinitomicaceae bacterium]|nr:2-oxo acid dehydrogenase subunit E2 [Crocinitomicaceae bacterium]
MSQIELLLPKMGESVAEATIIKWVKNEGDVLKADEAVIEIATDKVDSEVPSPEDGILLKCLVKEGEVVQVGQPIALIGVGTTTVVAKQESVTPPPAEKATPHVGALPVAVQHPSPAAEVLKEGSSGKFYSPLVRNIAKAEGIVMSELESISGTGLGGRVTKSDILSYVENRGKRDVVTASNGSIAGKVTEAAVAPSVVAAPAVKQPVSVGPNDEIIEMDRMRKLIADHMVMSKHTSPHVTSYVEADVTHIVMWREKVKEAFERNEKTRLTFTPIFIEAVARAIKDFPGVNVSVDGSRIIKRSDINIGMATALPNGNLIVPVIRNADQLNLVGLAKKVNDLADRARNNKLSPDDIQGGTYTLTNVGTFGNVMGTPIINQPQAAILAVGAIRKKPAVIETPQGDAIAIRQMMFLSHSYDHRVVDGALGGSFVRRVADYLESFDVNRKI